MKSLSTWLLAMFMVMFSAFRIVVVIKTQQGSNLGGLISSNIYMEIGLIFLTLLCLLLVIKRKMIGAILYSISYIWFFGTDLFNTLTNGIKLNITNSLALLSSGIGILLPLMVLFDTLLDKSRKVNPIDKQTDWFYKNEQYDRKFDERADRNEYKL